MLSRTLTATASFMALLCGCGPDGSSLAENSSLLPSSTAAQRPGSHTKLVEHFTEALVNPCNGEEIVFTGVAINQINVTGDSHLEFQGRASGTGIGPESGATYNYNVTGYESTNWGNGNDLQVTFGAGANARMISSLPELTFTAHFQFHGVKLPSGEITVTRSVDRVECKA
jgi:hypothetical protein